MMALLNEAIMPNLVQTTEHTPALVHAGPFANIAHGTLPVCVAKTQVSLTDNPWLHGAPRGFTLTVTDIALAAGAGFVVVVAGNMMRMPGLGRVPQAVHLDVTDDGEITGLR
jgi:formate--tetrahydrofolate ligase